MKAMILAAGRGKRMGELTAHCPKPLLPLAGTPLIVWQIQRLRDNGFCELVINLGYRGEQIREALGDGEAFGVDIQYSEEPQTGLETGGGVFQALPLLGDAPFLLTNADVFCDYPYRQLRDVCPDSVHLVLVDNPDFKAHGDFSLCPISDNNNATAHNTSHQRLIRGEQLTFAGISVIHPRIFAEQTAGFYPIAPLFFTAIAEQTATAEHFRGMWHDIGTPERLQVCEQRLNDSI